DRHRLGIGVHARELRDESRARAPRLPHTDDAAAADMEAGVSHTIERIQPVVLGAGRNDFAVELGRSIYIVVVVVEAGGLELLGLAFPEQTQRRATLEPFRAHRLHHFDHLLELALLGAAPGRAHAKAR